MIIFKNPTGNSFPAVGTIQRKHTLNGEKSLTGVLYDGDDVLNALDKGWKLTFDDEPYVVTYSARNDGDNSVEFDAVHQFFWDMTKSVFYESWSGSHTVQAYLDAIFADTGYTYALNFSPSAIEIDNWGMTNKLSLFNGLITSMAGDFEINGTLVSIYSQIGSDLSTIVRYGFNLSDMTLENSASDFVTYGEGFGAYADPDDTTSEQLHVTYKSPLYDVYGRLDAEPINDQRYTKSASLLDAVKAKVDNSFTLSVQLSLYDLTAAGYPYKMAQVGDWIMAIDENLDFKQRIRIIDVQDEFDASGSRISYTVTAGDVSAVQKYEQANAQLSSQVSDAVATSKQASEVAQAAIVSANGKNTSYYLGSVDDLPAVANEGDMAWIQVGDDIVLYVYTKKADGTYYWQKRVDPEIGEQVATAVDDAVQQAKAADAILNQQLSQDITDAASEANTALETAKSSVIDTATQLAEQAKAETLISAQSTAKSLADSAQSAAIQAAVTDASSKLADAKSYADDALRKLASSETLVAGNGVATHFGPLLKTVTSVVVNHIIGHDYVLKFDYENKTGAQFPGQVGDPVSWSAVSGSNFNTMAGVTVGSVSKNYTAQTVASIGLMFASAQAQQLTDADHTITFKNIIITDVTAGVDYRLGTQDWVSTVANTVTFTEVGTSKLAYSDLRVKQLKDSWSVQAETIKKQGDDITTNTAGIDANAKQIALAAKQTDLNTVTGRLSAAETALTLKADGAALTAVKTTADNAYTKADGTALAGRVTTAEAALTINANAIALAAKKTDVDMALATKQGNVVRATSAPSSPVAGALWIDTSKTPNVLMQYSGTDWVKASATTAAEVGAYSQTDANTLASRVTTAEGNITVANNKIDLAVTKTDYQNYTATNDAAVKKAQSTADSKYALSDGTALASRVTTAEGRITTLDGQVKLTAKQADLDTLNNGVSALSARTGTLELTATTLTTQFTDVQASVNSLGQINQVVNSSFTPDLAGWRIGRTGINGKMSDFSIINPFTEGIGSPPTEGVNGYRGSNVIKFTPTSSTSRVDLYSQAVPIPDATNFDISYGIWIYGSASVYVAGLANDGQNTDYRAYKTTKTGTAGKWTYLSIPTGGGFTNGTIDGLIKYLSLGIFATNAVWYATEPIIVFTKSLGSYTPGNYNNNLRMTVAEQSITGFKQFASDANGNQYTSVSNAIMDTTLLKGLDGSKSIQTQMANLWAVDIQSAKTDLQSQIIAGDNGIIASVKNTGGVLNASILGLFDGRFALGVSNNLNQITSGVFGSVDGMTVKGSSVTIDANMVTITGQTFITDAMISNVSASKMTLGTLDASKVNVANLDAGSIATGTLSGVNVTVNKTLTVASGGKMTWAVGGSFGSYSTNPQWIANRADSNAGNPYFEATQSGTATVDTNGAFDFQGTLTAPASQLGSTNFRAYAYDGAYTLDSVWSYSRFGIDGLFLRQYKSQSEVGTASHAFAKLSAQNLIFGYEAGNPTVFVDGAVGNVASRKITLYDTFSKAVAAGETATLDYGGGQLIVTVPSGMTISGDVAITGAFYSTGSGSSSAAANVYMTSAGKLVKSTSARKYKSDIQYVDDDDMAEKLLQLRPATWIDKAEDAAGTNVLSDGTKRRWFGMIADDFKEVGLEEVLAYDADGEVDGLQYDRIPIIYLNLFKRIITRLDVLEGRFEIKEN